MISGMPIIKCLRNFAVSCQQSAFSYQEESLQYIKLLEAYG